MSDDKYQQPANEIHHESVDTVFEKMQVHVDTAQEPEQAIDTSSLEDQDDESFAENTLVENYTPRELMPLAKVSAPDARAIFTNVKPSSWTFQLWTEDPDADLNQNLGTQESDVDERLIGMCQALQNPKPVCHAQPDLLTWLQDNGHTGPIAMEFTELGSNRPPRFVYLHIPKAPKESAQPMHQTSYANPQGFGAGAQPLSTASILQQMLIQMQQQQAQIQQSHTDSTKMIAEIIRDSRNEQRELMAAMFESQREEKRREVATDPMRDLGMSLHSHALQQMQEKITDISQGGLAGVKRTIENGQIAQQELSKMMPDKEDRDEEWDFIKDVGKDWVRGKVLGKSATSSSEDTMKRMLDQLGSQGNEILNEVL